MPDQEATAKRSMRAASAAESLPRGTDQDTENSPISYPEDEGEISRRTASGSVAHTIGKITPACSGALTPDETLIFLAKLRRGRDAGYLPTLPDFDLLLEIAERRTR